MSREVALIGVLVFAMVALGGISAQYQTAVSEASNETRIVNETASITAGDPAGLNESNRDVVYNESIIVRQNGTEWASDGNYTWVVGNGTLLISDPTNLNTTESIGVTYGFWVPSGAQQVSRDVVLLPYTLGDSVGIIVGAALLLTAVALLGRQR